MSAPSRSAASGVLFGLAFGYFACYVPYSAITKALTSAAVRGESALTGLSLLPLTTLASLASMIATITALGWWRYAHRPGQRWPRPGRWTLLSGLATAAIVVSTTLAYTFEGVSLPFVMLIMRGGVLVLAPMVDLLAGRRIRWFSWLALGLSLISLADAFRARPAAVPVLCALDLALYLGSYFVRLRLMERLGKSEDPATRRRYFVEEQMVATPAAVVGLALIAALGPRSLGAPLRDGFFTLWSTPTAAWAIVAGICSQGTGVFGGLLLLDASEATYCVPLNRAASILGGIVASVGLALGFGLAPPSGWELAGAGALLLAIAVLWLGPQAPISGDARGRRTRPRWLPRARSRWPRRCRAGDRARSSG
jgi:drug/metabolite transporter (DMT)-like permease